MYKNILNVGKIFSEVQMKKVPLWRQM